MVMESLCGAISISSGSIDGYLTLSFMDRLVPNEILYAFVIEKRALKLLLLSSIVCVELKCFSPEQPVNNPHDRIIAKAVKHRKFILKIPL